MRTTGFYKVKHFGEWIVARWSEECECWYLAGVEGSYYDVDFDKIAPRPIHMPGY